MRLGVYGGTFDPIHYGHLVLAEQCREQLGLDEVRFLPAGHPPHKPDQKITPGQQRAEMVGFAIAGHPQFKLDRRELQRPGPSFTVDTLLELQSEQSDAELFLLLGADSLVDLPHWREPARIAQLATIVAVNRAGGPALDVSVLKSVLSDEAVARIRLLAIPGCDLSATDLRQRAREGRSLRYLTPRAVECYIQEKSVYA